MRGQVILEAAEQFLFIANKLLFSASFAFLVLVKLKNYDYFFTR